MARTLERRDLPAQEAREAKIELAAAFRAAALHGFNEGIDNHFSLAVPGADGLFYLNRFGPHWSEIRASDLLTVDSNGRLVDGDGEWEPTAFEIHLAAHRAHPEARACFHVHTPYATALCMTECGLNTRAGQAAMLFHNRLARVPYGGIALDASEGDRMATGLGPGISVVMLDGHGIMVVGASVADAWHKLYFFERACQAQVLAQSTGSPLIEVDEETAEATARVWEGSSSQDVLFAAERRILDRRSPGYED